MSFQALIRPIIVLVALAGTTALPLRAQQDPSDRPPPPPAGEFKAGAYPLKLDYDRDGVLYVPTGYKPGTPMPLMLWLHGAGGSSAGIATSNTARLADEFGVIVLAPDSRDWTWDIILGSFGADIEYIRQALLTTFEHLA